MSDSDSASEKFSSPRKPFVYDTFENFPGSLKKFWTKPRMIGAGIILALLIILIVLVVVFTTRKSSKKTETVSNGTISTNAFETSTISQIISISTSTPTSASTPTSTSTTTPLKCILNEDLKVRIDCFPENQNSAQSECNKRGCIWKRPDENNDPCVNQYNIPTCFFEYDNSTGKPMISNHYKVIKNFH